MAKQFINGPKNNKKGSVELAGRTWYWQQKVLKTTDNNMRSLEMEVRLNEGDTYPISVFTTYVSKPSS